MSEAAGEVIAQLAPGLARWTAAHPQWSAASSEGWGPIVGSVLYEAPDTVVLFDPLIPAEGRERFLRELDERVAGRPVSILTTIRWHRRDREELATRYARSSKRQWNAVPPGVEQRPLRGAGETVYWLPGAAALVFGDRLIGDGEGGLALSPEGWLDEERVDRRGLAHLMRGLIELPVERVIVSHGEPVLHDGRAALAAAIRRAEAD